MSADLHRDLIVIDGHSDILRPVANGWCRLRDRTPRAGVTTADSQGLGQYDIPRWQEGGLTCQLMAINIDDAHLSHPLERAFDLVHAFYRELEANPDSLLHARRAEDIRRAKRESKVAWLLTMEGLDPLGYDLKLLDIFYHLGVRVVQPVWSRRNAFGDGTQHGVRTGGLTQLGRRAITRMDELGIVIDLAHMNDVGFWEVLEITRNPVVVTHTSPARRVPGYREPYDVRHPQHGVSKLEAIARRGGVVGIIFWDQPDVDAIVADVEFVITAVGPDHVAIGSDFFGTDKAPEDLQDIAQLPVLTDRLLLRGHSPEVVAKVMGGNYLRVFQTVMG